MLTHPTYDRLIALGLTGMARALEEQRSQPDASERAVAAATAAGERRIVIGGPSDNAR